MDLTLGNSLFKNRNLSHTKYFLLGLAILNQALSSCAHQTKSGEPPQQPPAQSAESSPTVSPPVPAEPPKHPLLDALGDEASSSSHYAERHTSMKVLQQAAQRLLQKPDPDPVRTDRLLAQARKIDPTNPYVYFFMALQTQNLGQCAKANTYFNQARTMGLPDRGVWGEHESSFTNDCEPH